MTPDEAYSSVVTGLREALRGEARLRVAEGPADRVDRETVIVGPPSFAWEGLCSPVEPTSMVVTVYLVTVFDERSVERLLAALPGLLLALASVNDATITDAVPGAYPTSGAEMPCYRLTAEMTL